MSLLSALGLRFSDSTLEHAFQAERAEAAMPLVRLTLAFGVVMMVFGLLVDPYVQQGMRAAMSGAEYLQMERVVRVTAPTMFGVVAAALVMVHLPFVQRRVRTLGAIVAVLLGAVMMLPMAVWGPPDMAARSAWIAPSFLVVMFFLLGLGLVRSCLWALPILAIQALVILVSPSPESLVPVQAVTTMMILQLCMYGAWRLEHAEREAFVGRGLLQAEKDRSDRLLLNILPDAIAERLKVRDTRIADGHPEVTVLFSDLVGFTRLTSRISPQELVALLHELVCAFDQISERHGLEKIKTIGDAYMAAAGLPEARADHAVVAVQAALDMVACVRAVSQRSGHPIAIRIGLHSGPVVAGVIGTHKFAYDLWGDTVNTAYCMESHGRPGRVQISASTLARLAGRFKVEERGVIDVKGLGKMKTYLVRGDGRLAASRALASAQVAPAAP